VRWAAAYQRLVALLFFLSPIQASADEWLMPTVRTYYSRNHHVRFTVTPREISSALSYFEGKVRNEKLAGQKPGSHRGFACGVLEKEDDAGHWSLIWRHRLVNDVSPVSAVVSNSARYVVTFDNWHFMGWGDDAIVIYGPDASVIRSLSLKDILPDYYVSALPRTSSSIWWSGEHYIAEPSNTLILKIVIPTDQGLEGRMQYVDLPLLLATGQVAPSTDVSWRQALAKAARVAKAMRAAEAARDVWFRSPLVGPRNTLEPDWHEYLDEAFFRTDPSWKDDYPWTTVLRSPSAKDYAASEQWVREDLEGKGGGEGAIMVASPASPENLVRLIEATVPKLKRGTLKGRRFYLCVPASYRDRAAIALAPTGATFIHLDPDVPIPQRRERLEADRKPDRG
jgi:hypothetical protein